MVPALDICIAVSGAAEQAERTMRTSRQKFGFERLEDRRLLAADLGAELAQCDFSAPAVQCEVEAVPACVAPETIGEIETPDFEIAIDQVAPAIALDLADGSDGYFGTISPDQNAQTFTIGTMEAGQVDVVIASSPGLNNVQLDVVDQNGDLVAETNTECLEGFQTLTFAAEADATYTLTVNSEEGASGNFQVTAGFESIPEPTDLHADEMGSEATELELIDGQTELTGELERPSDIDVFRFNSQRNGIATLFVGDVSRDADIDLDITVHDANGERVADGATNEVVMISFDLQADCEYYISVNAAEGQTGQYSLLMDLVAYETSPNVELADAPVSEWSDIQPVDGVFEITGELESVDETDGFRFTACQSSEMTVEMDAESEGNQANVSVSVSDQNGDPIVSGTTNDEVGIRFDAVAGNEYLVAVDALNDLPATYEVAIRPIGDVPIDSTDLEIEDSVLTADQALAIDDIELDDEFEQLDLAVVEDDVEDIQICTFAANANAVFEEFGSESLEASPIRQMAFSLESDFNTRFRG